MTRKMAADRQVYDHQGDRVLLEIDRGSMQIINCSLLSQLNYGMMNVLLSTCLSLKCRLICRGRLCEGQPRLIKKRSMLVWIHSSKMEEKVKHFYLYGHS